VLDGLSRWSSNVRVDGEHIALAVSSEADLPAINRYLVGQGADVYVLKPQTLSLEDLFIQVVGTEANVLSTALGQPKRVS
jgi:hypothetical protein